MKNKVMTRVMCFVVCALLCAMAVVGLTGCSEKETDDWAKIEKAGTMKIGVTIYKPMNYKDDSGKWTGFETEFAEAVCKKLGVKAEFVEIDWNSKVIELNAGNIDCIWNGMTVTDELKASIGLSESYIRNKQVCVIRKADAEKYTSLAAMAGAAVVAEDGSAGATVAKEDANLKVKFTPVGKQTDALMEVKSGTADVAVIDIVMAQASVGDNTDYSDLQIVTGIELPSEEYAIGFRKADTATQAKVKEAIDALIKDGTLNTIAEKYGLKDRLIANQK